MKKIKFQLREYKTSELETIATILNDLRVQEVSVHSFGQFPLSNNGFVLHVMPYMTRLKHLKLDIKHTFCQG